MGVRPSWPTSSPDRRVLLAPGRLHGGWGYCCRAGIIKVRERLCKQAGTTRGLVYTGSASVRLCLCPLLGLDAYPE